MSIGIYCKPLFNRCTYGTSTEVWAQHFLLMHSCEPWEHHYAEDIISLYCYANTPIIYSAFQYGGEISVVFTACITMQIVSSQIQSLTSITSIMKASSWLKSHSKCESVIIYYMLLADDLSIYCILIPLPICPCYCCCLVQWPHGKNRF